MSSEKTALILGFGYTGRAIEAYGRTHFSWINIKKTSRTSDRGILFDLHRSETWQNLPQVDFTFWTFPAIPLPEVEKFLQLHAASLGRIVVIGTTGAFVPTVPHQVFNETSPPDRIMERVTGEQYVQQRSGIVVYASGIYGPGRNPLDWIKKGRVFPTDKHVNFTHVDDLAQTLWAAMLRGTSGRSYISSDEGSYTWKELFQKWMGLYELPTQTFDEMKSTKLSKRIDAYQTRQALRIQLTYKDVIAGVDAING